MKLLSFSGLLGGPMRPTAKKLLQAAKSSAFLTADPLHMRYLTQSDVEMGYLLATRTGFQLFTNLHFLNHPEKLRRRGIRLRDTKLLEGELRKHRVCTIESEKVSVDLYAKWKKKFSGTRCIPLPEIVATFRRQKDAEELRHMQRARAITIKLFHLVPRLLRGSVSEADVARAIEIAAIQLGADGMAFPSIVSFGENTSVLHHRPTSRTLRRGDIVQIDIGARYQGYCADKSDVFFTAPPLPEYTRIYRALKKAQREALSLAHPGVPVRQLDAAARAVLQKAGIEDAFVHSLGHGVGLEIHEGVSLTSRDATTTLLRNEVVTIEPGVYFPGKFGIRVEDTFVVR